MPSGCKVDTMVSQSIRQEMLKMKRQKAILAGLLLCLFAAAQAAAQNVPIPAPDKVELPNVALIDQQGRRVNFVEDVVKDRIVVVTTFFTECAAICPVTGQKFAQLAKLLGSRLGREVVLVSVSVDPENDTPAEMREWMEPFHVSEGWSLLSGSRTEIDRLLKSLGLYVEAGAQRHQSGVLIGSPKTGWVRASALESPEKWNKLIDKIVVTKSGEAESATSSAGGGRK
jgi:protein SCO1